MARRPTASHFVTITTKSHSYLEQTVQPRLQQQYTYNPVAFKRSLLIASAIVMTEQTWNTALGFPFVSKAEDTVHRMQESLDGKEW